jgi:cysteinyl-tRNA synthetase
MESGRALDAQDEKREKIDFALWKKALPSHIMRWNSPWGEGFPGWHIECTVMSTRYLGETFDIHGGGMDLKFPHHECEIAQATGANGKSPVNYWLHSNMLTVNGQKMSKSLGNSFLPSELISGNHPLLTKGYSPMTVRFFMLQSHYSSTLDFSNEALVASEKGYRKLANALTLSKKIKGSASVSFNNNLGLELKKLSESCYANMSDDFNSAKTLAVLFEMASRINDMHNGVIQIDSIEPGILETFLGTYSGFMEDVLGLKLEETGNHDRLDGVLNLMIKLRQKARADRNYQLSDQIRDDLKAIGIQIKDGKDGSMSYELD